MISKHIIFVPVLKNERFDDVSCPEHRLAVGKRFFFKSLYYNLGDDPWYRWTHGSGNSLSVYLPVDGEGRFFIQNSSFHLLSGSCCWDMILIVAGWLWGFEVNRAWIITASCAIVRSCFRRNKIAMDLTVVGEVSVNGVTAFVIHFTRPCVGVVVSHYGACMLRALDNL